MHAASKSPQARPAPKPLAGKAGPKQTLKPKVRTAKPAPRLPLTGLVLILDPGHGGEDPGAHGVFRGENVWEAPYTFDQAARVKYFAEQRGAKVFTTVACKEAGGHQNWPAEQVLEWKKNCRFTLDGSQVVAGKRGLDRRVRFANQIAKKHRGQKMVFLSLHFDIAGEDSQGAFVIVPKEYKPTIAQRLVNSLNGLASTAPLRVAGRNGQKNIHVLRGQNAVRERVLIELGNFRNEHDNYIIRNYETRNRFAIRIADALQQHLKGGRK
jgi:N-acetylmuramoyl-L-alanine amidase